MNVRIHRAGLWRALSTALAVVASTLPVQGAARATDAARAAGYFEEARALSARDGGRMWGVELYGPILLADPKTRRVFANRADERGVLSPEGAVFAGTLPPEVNVSNTAIEWAGLRWTMVRLPLPEAREPRLALLAHELFHRIQHKVGVPMTSPSNAHLDSLEGRYLMQLEWRALGRALSARGGIRVAVADALVFRERRRALFAGAAAEERALELNEGLAEYTGRALAAETPEARRASAVEALERGPEARSFTRSFAYASGPAYGVLLDDGDPRWRAGLDASSDLGRLLARAYGVRDLVATPREVESRARRYDGAALREAEARREATRRELEAADRRRFVDGPTLELPFTPAMHVAFDPGELRPLEGFGTVYPSARVTDEWGVATVTGGMLLSSDWRSARLAAPEAGGTRPLRGDGWTLELAAGWEVIPAERPGSYRLHRGDSLQSRYSGSRLHEGGDHRRGRGGTQ